MTARPPTAHNVPTKDGCLQLILGPMFSGKTTELIRRIRRHHIARFNCVMVKYAKDTRFSEDAVATHDEQTFTALAATKLADVMEHLRAADVIGIDEGQFFSDIRTVAEQLSADRKIVIIAALDGDYKQEAFEEIIQLIPKAEFVNKLHAVCMHCYKDASFTKRMTLDTEREVIGGADKYISACRACHALPIEDVTTSQPTSAVKATSDVSPYKTLPYTVMPAAEKVPVVQLIDLVMCSQDNARKHLFTGDVGDTENSNQSVDAELAKLFAADDEPSPKKSRIEPLLLAAGPNAVSCDL